MIGLRITLTKKANKDEAAIYKYISEKFGERYADKFREKLLNISMCFLNSPLFGRPSKNNSKLRVYIHSKQNKIVYKVSEYELVIIRIIHTKTLSAKF